MEGIFTGAALGVQNRDLVTSGGVDCSLASGSVPRDTHTNGELHQINEAMHRINPLITSEQVSHVGCFAGSQGHSPTDNAL